MLALLYVASGKKAEAEKLKEKATTPEAKAAIDKAIAGAEAEMKAHEAGGGAHGEAAP